jgi:endoribonuclease LACTB2
MTPSSFGAFIRPLSVRTPTLPPATHTESYLIGTGEAILVEPASPYEDEIDRTLRFLDAAREGGIELVALFVTHHHVDHIGALRALGQRLALPLWAHEATAARLPDGIAVDRAIAAGESIELDGDPPIRLEAIHTPGHAPGHLCLFEPESRAMIAGDMVASVGTILVEPRDGDMSLYLESLERMRALEPSVLLPAHGAPIEAADAKLRDYRTHRLWREERVHAALVAHGPGSAAALVPFAYADSPSAVWPLAALSAEAHLLKLEKDGRALRTEDGWLAR